MLEGPGSEIHYLVFDASKAPVDNLAVRQAIAQVIDRAALASTVYADTVTPLYSLLPAALLGAKPAFQTTYGAPSVANAQATLAAAGITTPVALDAWYTPTHYGPEEAAGLGEIRRQLEASGLFTVKVGAQEWDAYKTAAFSRAQVPRIYGLGWFADYRRRRQLPLAVPARRGLHAERLRERHGELAARPAARVDQPDRTRRRSSASSRTSLARDVPVLPLWERKQIVAVRTGVEGVEKTFDPALQMRFWLLSKR